MRARGVAGAEVALILNWRGQRRWCGDGDLAVTLRPGGDEHGTRTKFRAEKASGGITGANVSDLHRLRRFYRVAGVQRVEPGSEAFDEDDVEVREKWSVVLDGRTVRTPKRKVLYAPSESLAWAVAFEWDSQRDVVNSFSMPVMTLMTSTLDKVVHGTARLREDLVAQQANFVTTDQAVFRSAENPDLADRQEAELEPVVRWFEREFRVSLPRSRSYALPEADVFTVRRIYELLHAASPWEMACVDALTSATKSLVLAMAAIRRHIPPAQAFALSRVDETYQLDKIGIDDPVHDLSAIDVLKSISSASFVVSLLPPELRTLDPVEE